MHLDVSYALLVALLFLGAAVLVLAGVVAYKTRAKIRGEAALLRMLTEAATDGFWDWDIATGKEQLSPRGYTALGFDLTRVKPKRTYWQDSIHPEDRERAHAAMRAHLLDGRPYAEVVRHRRSDGSYAWMLDRGVALKDASGQAYRMIGTHTDISALKEIESQLRQSNRDLEQFAYAASHDLQEPLRMITSWTSALFEDHGDKLMEPEAQQMKHFIIDGVNRMRTLIRDLLSFSQAGRGIQTTMVSPRMAISSAVRNLAGALNESGGRIVIEDIPNEVFADGAMLAQVFQNLLSNSLKFRRKGVTPVVTITAEVRDSEIRFSVIDNGLGIAQHHLPRVFEVFTRLYSTAEYEGTGIGLALVRRIVHAHGGDIGIDSPGPDQGTTAWFTLQRKGTP